MKHRILFLVIVACMVIPLTGLPELTVHPYADTAPGGVFLSNFVLGAVPGNAPCLMILGNDGQALWSREMPGLMYLDFKMQNDDLMTYFDFTAGKFYGLDRTFTVIDSFAAVGFPTDEHELVVLPDEHALLFGNDVRIMDLTASGGQSNARVVGFVVQELDAEGSLVFEWKSLDHIPVTEVADPDLLTGMNVDYIHCNAIDLDEDGNLLVSARHLDRIIKLDRHSGAILWQWGGERSLHSDIRIENDDWMGFTGFSHQHAIRYLGNHRYLMFDNGNLKDTPSSRVVEYELDPDSLIARKVWQYAPNPPVFSSAMGYAHRLENGNTLIGWGQNDAALAAREVDPAGNTLWEVYLPEGVYSYRAFRFPCEWLTPDFQPLLTRVSEGSFDLSWSPVSGVSGYRVWYCSDPRGSDWTLFREVSAGTLTTRIDNSAARGYFRITAQY